MKKKYLKPEIEEVKIDTTVTLMSMSGDNPELKLSEAEYYEDGEFD